MGQIGIRYDQTPNRHDSENMTDSPLTLLNRIFGYDTFRGDQQAVVEHVCPAVCNSSDGAQVASPQSPILR